MFFLLITVLFSVWPAGVRAQFSFPPFPIINLEDIPRKTESVVTKATNTVQKALKDALAIAFKNTLEKYNAKIAQEVLTGISTAGPGQKPLFLTNPKTFFRNVVDSATGDFINEFTLGLTGETGPGAPTSSSRQKFLISRILRKAVGSPIEGCRESCRQAFSVGTIFDHGVGIDPNDKQTNEHTKYVQLITNHLAGFDIKPGTRELAARKEPDMRCLDVALPIGLLLPGQTYLPWQILPGACTDPTLSPSSCQTSAEECERRQTEAINIEYSIADEQTRGCFQSCQVGSAAATEGIVTDLTATDIFVGLENLDTKNATAQVAQGLSSDRSDFGQLLGTLGLLGVAVDDKVTGERTTLTSGATPRTSKVSEVVLVPREAGQQSLAVALAGGDDAKKIFTGTGAADIIKGVVAFINSPLAKMLTGFFKNKCGLNPDACRGPSQPSSSIGQLLFGSGGPTGLAAAKIQYATYGKADILTGEPGRNEVAVADELSSSGLIDAQFRNAIEDRLTIQEALDQGRLDPRKTFGFDKNGVQPREGYPYRALQYLRKYRITPVGWELAALYSQRHDPRDLSLGFLTEQFNRCDQDDQHRVCSQSLTACTVSTDCASGETCGASPYCGLIDPNWVLKAPQTYCRRQGAGEEIITKQFVCDADNVLGSGDTQALGGNRPDCVNSQRGPDLGRWVVSRNTDTCADVQSCIAENEDGTCIAFGYCVQERDAFKFDGDRCDAQFASCTTYTDDTGKRAAYLASTLDFRNCSADVAGCQWFCNTLDPVTKQWVCGEPTVNDTPATPNTVMRFTKNVQTCNQGSAGCRQFIRTTNGTNLLANGGFEYFSGAEINSGQVANLEAWQKSGGIGTFPVTPTDASATSGNVAAVGITASGALVTTVDTGYPLYERSFTASVRARADSACSLELTLAVPGSSLTTTVNANVLSEWGSPNVVLTIPSDNSVSLSSNALTFTIGVGTCGSAGLVIDNAQLEPGSQTQYKDYASINNVFLNGTRLACAAEDVGCESYTPVSGGQKVTGQIRSSNRCSEDNVGCAAFTLEPIAVPLPRPGGLVNIIPNRGQQCSATDVGCEEYTNLDEVAAGGEGREFYKSVKQCVKPDVNDARQAVFYTWVGDAQRGFLLRAHTLLRSNIAGAGTSFAPCTNVSPVTGAGGTPSCSDTAVTVASCTQADLATNPDCAEYYDSSLNVYYRLRSRTVSVTDDCRPFRNTVDQTDADSSNDNNIYFLSPRENVSCSESAAGCRAYTGNSGRTTRVVLNDTFESSTSRWVGGQHSSESTSLGGHSMYIPVGGSGKAAAYTQASVLQGQLTDGRSYLVSFWGAAATASSQGATIKASFGNGSGSQFTEGTGVGGQAMVFGTGNLRWNAGSTPAGPEWQLYTLGPVVLVGQTAQLGITVTGGEGYVDNVVLTEITDSVYLVSSSVPICPASEVGCAAYRDRAGQNHFVKSFDRICAERFVGCEAMIDTQNSATPFDQIVKNELTPADQVVTVVNNRGAYCDGASKGCQAFGRPIYTTDQVLTGFQTVYLKNDPDLHARDLCLQEELFCRAFTTTEGTSAFFKDPSHRTCEFKADTSEVGGGWYIVGTDTRCPTVTPPLQGRPVGASCSQVCQGGSRAGRACVDNADCAGALCAGDAATVGMINTGIASNPAAFGQCTINPADGTDNCLGGNKCVYLAGLCPEGQNGCNEYRDPTEPTGCRSECPYLQQGGSPIYLDQSCVKSRCVNSTPASLNGQNCQTSAECGTGQCVGLNNAPTTGLPGCFSYFYLRQSVEDTSAECNGLVDPDIGCRPFNDVSKSTLNFRGE